MTSVTRIHKGLDLPIAGQPEQVVRDGPTVKQVALIGDDYRGMKPTMAVAEGERVQLGQVLFEDKKTPGVFFTAPAAGTVSAIYRGEKRKFLGLVIDVEGDDQVAFPSYVDRNLARLDRVTVVEQLRTSGLWTALRTRPYSKTPVPDSIPHSIFVTAIDTNPLAADPAVIINKRPADFVAGLETLSTLTDGPLYVCRRAGAEIPGEGSAAAVFHAFDGPHPAGLVGTHIHLLDPVHPRKTVWHIGYQDVLAIGHLMLTGRLASERIVSLAGPVVSQPSLVRTVLGANLSELTASRHEVPPGRTARIISGSVLSGRRCLPPVDFLGRFDTQVSVLAEGGPREFLGWLNPGQNKFSIRRVFASAWMGSERRFAMNTSTNGSPRAVVPIGMYEDVMPLDLVATPLLKSLLTDDTGSAQELGALELDEEDLSLCSFVCPGKHDFGPLLRKNLTRIETEG